MVAESMVRWLCMENQYYTPRYTLLLSIVGQRQRQRQQFFSLWYWGKSMMKNQQLYAEKSAYICWDFSRSFRPKTPPTTPFALFWHINFAGPKRKLALSHKVSFVFFKFYIICEMDTLSGLYYELFREKVIICGFSHTWFWSNTRPAL